MSAMDIIEQQQDEIDGLRDRLKITDEMVSRFLSWPLPSTVCADGCATNPKYPHPRSGTNLLNAIEAREMLEYVLGSEPPTKGKE